MRKNWHVKKINPALSRKLSHELSISPVLAQLLINRSVTDARNAKSFLNPQLEDLHEPFRLKDMDRALERLKKAVNKREKILIFGDYDVDGLTSSVVLMRALNKLGAEVYTYIPHRVKEGYGLNDNALKQACKIGASLVVCVDCGTNEHGIISKLKRTKIDTIVVDHHEPSSENLQDGVLINPLRRGCSYPYKYLSAAGLVYKLTQALDKEFSIGAEADLDLVALGTVCDVSPMSGENRILTTHGLNRLRHTDKVGLLALMDVARIAAKRIAAHHLGYILGPRLNAQGRLDSAEKSLRILSTDSPDEAKELASVLHLDNAQRQKIEARILTQALEKIQSKINFAKEKIIVLDDERWHPGVIGIVASKIVDAFYRPAILIVRLDGISRGSGRSIDGFDLMEALTHCKKYLAGFGGHEAACGLTIHPENITKFREAINEFAQDKLLPSQLSAIINIDMEIALAELRPDLVYQIEKLSPFGPENPKPLFLSRNLKLKSKPKYCGRKTVKFWVTDGKRTFEAISFGRDLPGDFESAGNLDIIYSPTLDGWQGQTFIQLEVEDMRPATSDREIIPL
ncbi:MAG: single-stranded-DNA-specific exonuclease RecJ [Candidatus Omnitrophota bacterium]